MYTEATLENDPFLVFSSDSGVSKVIAENSCYGAGELLVYEDILNDNDVFFDVGMNIGAISFQLKKRNPSLKIFGFEPVKEFYDLAVRNLSQFDGVNCFNIGLGSEEHTIGLPQFPITNVSNFGSAKLRDAGDEYRVKVQRLDDVPELSGVLPKLVKIDVEGQEDLVLDGMEKLIHDNICISIEADKPDTVKNYLEFLRSHKFNLSFVSLKMTNINSESRNIRYDNLSTAHIFAYYQQPSPYMNRMSTILNFDEYYSFIKPMIERPRFAL
ncbi:FkbM family methyltransferase [Alphaproteobacteria bacterium]|nr:FkbM family methyltransferase [Alphaproteobacteria bacterium]